LHGVSLVGLAGLSALVGAFGVALVNILQSAHQARTTFLLMGISLLGWGASGVVLGFAIRGPRGAGVRHVVRWSAAAAIVAMPLACWGLVRFPFDARLLAAASPHDAGWALLLCAILALPPLLAGTAVGGMLTLADPRLCAGYAAHSIGAAAGVAGAVFATRWVPSSWLRAGTHAVLVIPPAVDWPPAIPSVNPLVLLAMFATAVAFLVISAAVLRLTRSRWANTRRAFIFSFFTATGLGTLLALAGATARVAAQIELDGLAAAIAVSAFLLFSGLGSLSAGEALQSPQRGLGFAFWGMLGVGVAAYFIAALGNPQTAAWAPVLRATALVGLMAPVFYLMGFVAPAGLAKLQRGAPSAIAWAWTLHGCAAALAIPLVAAMNTGWNDQILAGAGLAFFGIAAGVYRYLPDEL
jgi:hypothetical protein